MIIRVEVRCCCQPQKLLGWLPVDEQRVIAGSVVTFEIPPMRHAGSWRFKRTPSDTYLLADRLTLPLERFTDTDGHTRIVFKSEETPIATLRRIPGFVDVPPSREELWLVPWPFGSDTSR
jgi:hypothetical protein